MKLLFVLGLAVSFLYSETLGQKRIDDYERFIKETTLLPKDVQLEKVNHYFNAIVNELDIHNWNIEDYWATPAEFIVRGKGDCEDFVIAKYFTLKQLGFDPTKMMIMIVKVDHERDFHAVLGLKNSTGEILILDNLSWKILPLTKRTDLKIVRWVNESIVTKTPQHTNRMEVENFRVVLDKISKKL